MYIYLHISLLISQLKDNNSLKKNLVFISQKLKKFYLKNPVKYIYISNFY